MVDTSERWESQWLYGLIREILSAAIRKYFVFVVRMIATILVEKLLSHIALLHVYPSIGLKFTDLQTYFENPLQYRQMCIFLKKKIIRFTFFI